MLNVSRIVMLHKSQIDGWSFIATFFDGRIFHTRHTINVLCTVVTTSVVASILLSHLY